METLTGTSLRKAAAVYALVDSMRGELESQFGEQQDLIRLYLNVDIKKGYNTLRFAVVYFTEERDEISMSLYSDITLIEKLYTTMVYHVVNFVKSQTDELQK